MVAVQVNRRVHQLAVIVMARNEADILPGLLAHTNTLFDRVFFVDHRSTDGSREILEAARAEWPTLEVFDYGVQGYFQSALSTVFVRKAFKEGADWVFFLDADEFVNVPDRAALLGALPTNGAAVCSFKWRNCAPTIFGGYQTFDLQQDFLVRRTVSRYGKVALSRSILQEYPCFRLAMGNHAIVPAPGAPAVEGSSVGEYFHIPIRSRDRLVMKLQSGVSAYRAKNKKQTDAGFHWFELLERMHADTVDDDFLRAVALEYGEPLSSVGPLSAHFPQRQPITPAGITGASILPRDGCRLARTQAESTGLDRALVWRQLQAEDLTVAVLIDGNNQVTLRPRIMRPGNQAAPECFANLPPENTSPADDFSEKRLTAALDMAFTPIETFVPSAWSNLAPVMFGLIALLRPRRFVELGTHHGYSFFAASQAIKALSLETEAIAIDTWQGDPQAGFYDEAVFKHFSSIIASLYRERSYYIRSTFQDAADCFEECSIDLLHIDGLHSYDEVRRDFETWLPKMSDRGVVILHDTTVYERGFGVWQLWQELKARYPSVNVLHSHGLGIVYVGTRDGRFVEALREFATDALRNVLLNAFLCNLGDLSISAARSAQKLSGTQAELAKSQAELAKSQAELAEVYASTSWRVSSPVRVLRRILRSLARSSARSRH